MAATLAEHVSTFLDEMTRMIRLRPHSRRAYRYELTAASVALTNPLDQLTLAEMNRLASRGAVTPSTVACCTATLSRFFTWAVRHQLCTAHPLAMHEPARRRQQLLAQLRAVPTAPLLRKQLPLPLSPTNSSSPCYARPACAPVRCSR